jgi:hypothetical protein
VELAIYPSISTSALSSINAIQLTLDVVLSVRLAGLVVVHHSNHMQQVILAQLLQTVGQLLHVDVLVPPALLLGCVLGADTVCVGGAGLCEEGEELGLGIPEGLGLISIMY